MMKSMWMICLLSEKAEPTALSMIIAGQGQTDMGLKQTAGLIVDLDAGFSAGKVETNPCCSHNPPPTPPLPTIQKTQIRWVLLLPAFSLVCLFSFCPKVHVLIFSIILKWTIMPTSMLSIKPMQTYMHEYTQIPLGVGLFDPTCFILSRFLYNKLLCNSSSLILA